MRSLADRLETFRIDLPSYRREELDACISIARGKEFLASDPHAHRRLEGPAVSFNNVSRQDLTFAQMSVLRVFEGWPHPMDERELHDRYQDMYDEHIETDEPLRFVKQWSSSIRSRRADLVKQGRVVKEDDTGTSQMNQRAGRFVLAPEPSPWSAAVPKKVTPE